MPDPATLHRFANEVIRCMLRRPGSSGRGLFEEAWRAAGFRPDASPARDHLRWLEGAGLPVYMLSHLARWATAHRHPAAAALAEEAARMRIERRRGETVVAHGARYLPLQPDWWSPRRYRVRMGLEGAAEDAAPTVRADAGDRTRKSAHRGWPPGGERGRPNDGRAEAGVYRRCRAAFAAAA